ncbi:MAG: AAA family ATPase [Polyangiaceae bacterium]
MSPSDHAPREQHVHAPREQVEELRTVLEAHHPLIAIETIEEDRVIALLQATSEDLGIPLVTWLPHRGIITSDEDRVGVHGTDDPARALAFIDDANRESIYHLRGFEKYLDDPIVIARMKDIYRKLSRHRGAIVIAAPEITFTSDVEPLFTHIELQQPTAEEYREFMSAVLREVRQRHAVSMELSREDMSALLDQVKGLTFFEVRRILTKLLVEGGRLARADFVKIVDGKQRIIERTGVLEYFPHDHTMAHVAGLSRFKEWIRKRGAAFRDPERAAQFGLTPPRGALLLGVQGCGKSLSAKAVAGEWGMPLVRLDPSNLYQRYVGETEKSLKRALRTAETMAPIVLWIDELEKAFGTSGESDGGVSRRVLGTFLAWLQEKTARVFVLATANDVTNVPPELMRKGRFDEIFFIDLPDRTAREGVLAVHLLRRGRDPSQYDLAGLARASEGFSGAELEQVIVAALFDAFSDNVELTDGHIQDELERTIPLSVTMSERVGALRSWAHERAVLAD